MLPQRAIVTGGSGFIGTNLVSFLLGRGWRVLNVDIVEPRDLTQSGCWRQVDLLDREELTRQTQAFAPSTFVHLGARTDLDERTDLGGYAVNIEGVDNVIEAIRSTPSIERALFASSQLVCKLGYVPRDESDYCPSTLYGQSKALSEQIIRTTGDIGPTWTIVRPTSVWGPWFGAPHRDFFQAIARGLYVHPRGIATLKQWGYVENVVFQMWKLIRASHEAVHRKTLYLADYAPVELASFADKVCAALGARPIQRVPAILLRWMAAIGDTFQSLGWKHFPLTSFRYSNLVTPEVQNLEPIRRIAGPLPYMLDQAIARTVEWLQDQCRGASVVSPRAMG